MAKKATVIGINFDKKLTGSGILTGKQIARYRVTGYFFAARPIGLLISHYRTGFITCSYSMSWSRYFTRYSAALRQANGLAAAKADKNFKFLTPLAAIINYC